MTVPFRRARAIAGPSTGSGPCAPRRIRLGQGPARRRERAEPGRAPRRAADRRPDRRSRHGHRRRSGGLVVRRRPPTAELAAAVDPGGLRREVFGFLPVLGAERQLDHARLGEDLDGRLLRRRGGRQGQPPEEEQRRLDDGRLERLDQLEDDQRHQRRARQRRAGRPDRPELRLVVDRPRPPEGAARQRRLRAPTSHARSPPPSATAAPTASTSTSSRSPRATPTSSPRSSARSAPTLNAVAKGYQLTFDTTGWIGNYPIEAATAAGGADAIVIMGYDYRIGLVQPGRLDRADRRPDATTSATRSRPTSARDPGLEGHPRRAVLRPRLVDLEHVASHAKNISGTKYGASSTVVYDDRPRVRRRPRQGATTPVEGVAWTAYRRENCTTTYGCVKPWRQLYYDDATALRAKYDLVNRYDLRGAGIWALGYDGTRPELYAALKAKFITDTVPPTIISGVDLVERSSRPTATAGSRRRPRARARPACITWGYRVQPLERATLGAAVRSGSRAGKTPSFTWDGRNDGRHGRRRRPYRLTLWAADASDNRAERGFDVTVDRTAPRSRRRPRAGTSRPTATVTTTRCRCPGKPRRRSPASSGSATRRGRRSGLWSFSRRTTLEDGMDGRDPRGRLRARRPLHVPRQGSRPGRQPDARRPDGPRRSDDLGRSLDRSVLRSARSARPAGRDQLQRAPRRSMSRSTGSHAGAAGLDGPVRQGRHVWLDLERQDGGGKYVKPGTLPGRRDATSTFGTTRFTRSVTVQVH